MADVIWSDPAIADVDEIIRYHLIHDPDAAVRIAAELFEAARRLEVFPRRGRRARGGGRELLTVWPYVLRYSIRQDKIVVQSVRHGARRRKTPL